MKQEPPKAVPRQTIVEEPETAQDAMPKSS